MLKVTDIIRCNLPVSPFKSAVAPDQEKGENAKTNRYCIDVARGLSFHAFHAHGFCSAITRRMKMFDYQSGQVFPAEVRLLSHLGAVLNFLFK